MVSDDTRQLHFYSAYLMTRFQEFTAGQKADKEKVPVF